MRAFRGTDRARVPFALAGVFLLVASATFSASLGPNALGAPASDRAIEEAEGAVGQALRSAAREAAREAAASPVVTPAATAGGRVLNDSAPFRELLRVRLYHALRDRLRTLDTSAGAVTVDASLPVTPTASALRAAKRRVAISRAGPNGTALRAGVENVTLVVSRDGTVVDRLRVSPTVVVDSPALFLHDRTARFDRALDAGPTKGLARRVTARLYAMAWARGGAQYGGVPIANVLANRHVALATNGGLLGLQREVFGAADPAGRRALGVATARTGARDLLLGGGTPSEVVDAIEAGADRMGAPRPVPPVGSAETADTLRVGVNATADAAFREIDMNATARAVYGARVRLLADSRLVHESSGGSQTLPGWTLVASRNETRTRVSDRPAAPAAPAGWHALDSWGRRVVHERTTVRTWRRGNETRVTRATGQRVYHVTLTLAGRHAEAGLVPDRPIRHVHERGGPLDGPNLAGLEARAETRLVGDRGGVDALATRATVGGLDDEPVRVAGERPAGLSRWLYADLVALRERVRNVSIAAEKGAVGTYETNPPAKLATELESRRTALLDVPREYGSVADKARYAVRAAYLDRVVARLETRAEHRAGVRGRLDGQLGEYGLSLGTLAAALDAARDATVPPKRTYGALGGPLELTVDGAPPYLTRTALSRERVAASGVEHREYLAARNVNLVTSPHGDVADSLVGSLLGTRTVRLGTAAATLRAARLSNGTAVPELRAAVAQSVAAARVSYRRRLRAAGVGDSHDARRAIVRTGLARWDTLPARASAIANGSAGERIAAVAAADAGLSALSRDRLRLALGGVSPPGVPHAVVNGTTDRLRTVVKGELTEVAKRGAGRVANRTSRRLTGPLAAVPAGLPVAPVPGMWYATANVWVVQVRGEYARFSVRTNRGVAYTRDGSAHRFDWDGDGEPELLGYGSRVSLSVETAVVVVVPPGPRGVGDTDGNADERSPGWNSKALRA